MSEQINTEKLALVYLMLKELLMETIERVCGPKTLVHRQITIKRHGGM